MIKLLCVLMAMASLFASGADTERTAKVSIAFAGDVYPKMLIDADPEAIRQIRKDLSDCHLAFCNLESPITSYTTMTAGKSMESIKARRDYVLRSPVESAKLFAETGFNVVSLANNHMMDYRSQGLLDTIRLLDQYNIKYSGAGKNIHEARSPVIVTGNGVKVGFVSYSEIVPRLAAGGQDYPGIAGISYPHTDADMNSIINSIKEARRQGAEIVVVSLHWGEEGSSKLEPYQRVIAEKLIDNGADCIIGHHPHVTRSIDTYKGKVIAYSLGNFIFSSGDRPTILLKITFTRQPDGTWTQEHRADKYNIRDCIPYRVK